MPTKRPTIAELQAEIRRKDKIIQRQERAIKTLTEENSDLQETTNAGLLGQMASKIEKKDEEILRLNQEVAALKDSHGETISDLQSRVNREFHHTPRM